MFDDQLASTTVAEPHRALYLRWRPTRFEDVVGQDHVTRTLRNAVKLQQLSHAYLFTGPRGTGKTSVARILYRAANCDQLEDGDPCNKCQLCRAALENRALDLIEIDAASNRGIENMRELRERVAYRPGVGRFRMYIIDEAHELTPQAWDAFLKTLEEPPPHVLFVMATTEAYKVPATIVSRCQRFDFRRIPFDLTRQQLAHIAAQDGMQVEPAVLDRIALVARGGLRDAESLLDQLSAFAGGPIDMALARAALSLPAVEAVRGVIDAVGRRDARDVMTTTVSIVEGGGDMRLFVEELLINLRALLLVLTRADGRLTDELPAAEVEWLRERAAQWSLGILLQLIQTLSEALARTRDAQQFQVQAEVALLLACDAGESIPGQPVVPDPVPVVASAAPRSDPPNELPIAAPASEAPIPPPVVAEDVSALLARWPDVIDHVRARKGILASLLTSARPEHVDNGMLVVAFSTEFNRKSAESQANRPLIEDALEHALGRRYRLRGTVESRQGSPNLLDDPVINYAARTFGGQPRRIEPSAE